MVILIRKREKYYNKKSYYMTVCATCGSKFAFSEDDTKGTYDDEYIRCPVCDAKIPHYVLPPTVNIVYEYFKKISYWKYNRFMKKYCTKDKTEKE